MGLVLLRLCRGSYSVGSLNFSSRQDIIFFYQKKKEKKMVGPLGMSHDFYGCVTGKGSDLETIFFLDENFVFFFLRNFE